MGFTLSTTQQCGRITNLGIIIMNTAQNIHTPALAQPPVDYVLPEGAQVSFAGQNELSDMVEEFVTLYNKLAPDLDRYELLKKKLGAAAALDKSAEPTILAGYTHVLDYTAPAEFLVLKVSPKAYVNATEDWESLTVSITQAKKNLSSHLLETLFEKKAGSRRFRRIR